MTRLLLFCAVALGLAACAEYRDTSRPVAPVASVDLSRYAGTWYEIARYPNWFERGCAGVTARYGIRPDGRLSVLNICRQGGPDGPLDTAEGVARAIDASNARLKVKFSWVPVEGDYFILYLDPGYRTAVVGAPSGQVGWILARTPGVSAAQIAPALEALQRNGYDLTRLEYTEQPPG